MEQNNTETKWWRRKGTIVLLLSLVVVAGLLGVFSLQSVLDQRAAEEEPPVPIDISEEEPKEPVQLTIVSVGDVMVHKPQIASQYDPATDTYNYDNNFQYVKSYIEEADLALCNVETTFGGGTPTGYPVFNAPDALADSLAKAGFDVGITSNNHLYDTGYDGMKRTLRILREAGLSTSGTKFPGEKNFSMSLVKGVQVAVVSYTYETPSVNGWMTINSAIVSRQAEQLINSFNYETLDEDFVTIKETIDEARTAGADIVICYYHWGEEYQRYPNEWQKIMAQRTADLGADMIFASHPHVLQGAEMLTANGSGKQVPVFYCMGNFLSNQREETLNNRYTEQGMIARVTLEYDETAGKITDIRMDAMRTWLDKYRENGKDVYAIVPLDERLEENEALLVSGHLSRAQQVISDVSEVLSHNFIWE